jgi:hypothetical protein
VTAAAVIRPSEFGALSLRALHALALAMAEDVDRGEEGRRRMLERIMKEIGKKAVVQ